MARLERDRLPGPAVSPIRRTIRYWFARSSRRSSTRAYLRLRLDGRERLPAGPAIYCFNHMSWADPFVLMAVAAVPAAPLVLRAEGGGHGGRRPEPADVLDRHRDPVQARRRTTCSRRPAGSRPSIGSGRRRRDRRRGPDPRRRVRPAAAERGRRLLRHALGRAPGPDRHHTARAGCASAAGSGSWWGSPSAIERPADPGGRRRRDRRARGRACTTSCRDAPDRRAAGPVRALADRAVQRLAGGLPRGGQARARSRCASPVWHTSSRPTRRRRDRGQRPACRPTRANTGPVSPTRAMTRSTPGRPSSCATS